jgi:hypothetical protein
VSNWVLDTINPVDFSIVINENKRPNEDYLMQSLLKFCPPLLLGVLLVFPFGSLTAQAQSSEEISREVEGLLDVSTPTRAQIERLGVLLIQPVTLTLPRWSSWVVRMGSITAREEVGAERTRGTQATAGNRELLQILSTPRVMEHPEWVPLTESVLRNPRLELVTLFQLRNVQSHPRLQTAWLSGMQDLMRQLPNETIQMLESPPTLTHPAVPSLIDAFFDQSSADFELLHPLLALPEVNQLSGWSAWMNRLNGYIERDLPRARAEQASLALVSILAEPSVQRHPRWLSLVSDAYPRIYSVLQSVESWGSVRSKVQVVLSNPRVIGIPEWSRWIYNLALGRDPQMAARILHSPNAGGDPRMGEILELFFESLAEGARPIHGGITPSDFVALLSEPSVVANPQWNNVMGRFIVKGGARLSLLARVLSAVHLRGRAWEGLVTQLLDSRGLSLQTEGVFELVTSADVARIPGFSARWRERLALLPQISCDLSLQQLSQINAQLNRTL